MTKFEANTKQNKKGGENWISVLNFSKGWYKGKKSLYFDFETFITPFIFFQIKLPGTLLNTKLNQLPESVIEFQIWASKWCRNIIFMKVQNSSSKTVYTVREQLFDTIALNDDISIKSSSNLKSNDRFGKLIQFCV